MDSLEVLDNTYEFEAIEDILDEEDDTERKLLVRLQGKIVIELIPNPEFENISEESAIEEKELQEKNDDELIPKTKDELIPKTEIESSTVQTLTEIGYPCIICKYEFKRKSNLHKHLRRMHRNTLLELKQLMDNSIGDKKENNVEMIKAIEALECKPKPVFIPHSICDCQLTFVTKRAKRRHMYRVHGKKERNYFCEFCSKSFKRGEHLSKHVKVVHKGIKNFSCGFCGKKFSQRSAMAIHEGRINTEERNCLAKKETFGCKVCGELFDVKHNMVDHVKFEHDKLRTFQCDICDKHFIKGHFKRHQKTVHKNKENDSTIQ